jgi:hypothetical protein
MALGHNRGDANDPFPGALGRTFMTDAGHPNVRSFSGAPTNAGLLDVVDMGVEMAFLAQVRAPGWHPATDQSTPGFVPLQTSSAAVTAGADVAGALYSVDAETIGACSQIVLRSRVGQTWQPPLVVSASTTGANEPSLVVSPSGDLFVAWSDARSGRWRIFGRARRGGSWTAEETLVDLPDDCRAPALAGKGQGSLHLAFIQSSQSGSSLWFVPFTWDAPPGTPTCLTGPGDHPTAPAIASGVDGHCYVVWPDSSGALETLWFASYHPDSGLSANLPLTPGTTASQPRVRAVVDGSGALHSVWIAASPVLHELHWQRRDFGGAASLADTVLERVSDGILDLYLAADPSNGLHLAYERLGSGTHQIRYRRRAPGDEWDFLGTEVTEPPQSDAIFPRVVPTSPGVVTVLYTGVTASGTRFMERHRFTDGPVTSVPRGIAIGVSQLTLGPNPLRAGQQLELQWNGDSRARDVNVDIVDVGGRRRGAVALRGDALSRRGRLDAAATGDWPGGVYFVRVRGERSGVARLIVLR